MPREDYDPEDFDDPRNPDHDLSESGIRVHREYDPKPFFLRRGFVLVLGILLIAGLILPTALILR